MFEQRHLVEVADDPERVVDDLVEGDRRVDHARQAGEQPADEAEEERRPRRVPGEARAVDREEQAVERERRDDRHRERQRLHRRVDRRLRRARRVVDVDVVRPHDHVRDDRDRPADGDDVAGHERRAPRSAAPAGSRSRPPGRAAGRRPGGRRTRARSSPAAGRRSRSGESDWTIISTSSTASGSVAMIMSIAITVSGITAYGTGRGLVANRSARGSRSRARRRGG